MRRAFLVEAFRPASIVPGLKTRRLDRLSAWALVASSLALRDAGIDLAKMDRSRIAVFFATGFGCVELTEAFFQSAATHGWAETDPILFPETLSNAPASHVALFHDLHGPNVTISSQGFAAESALLQASSLLRHGQADLAIVLAGDTLTQAIYEWYEAAHLLSPACFSKEQLPSAGGFIPSEGVVAMVLEAADRQRPCVETPDAARGLVPMPLLVRGAGRSVAMRGPASASCWATPRRRSPSALAMADRALPVTRPVRPATWLAKMRPSIPRNLLRQG